MIYLLTCAPAVLSTPRRLTVNFKCGEGFHFALFVRGGADVRPRILVGDAGNRQNIDFLETLRRKLSFQLNTETNTEKSVS